MKKVLVFFIYVTCLLSAKSAFAQTNTFPSSGSVGIGTINPLEKLNVYSSSSGVISRFGSLQNGGINGIRLQGKNDSGSDVLFLDLAFDAETLSYGFGAGANSGQLPITSGLTEADIFIDNLGHIGIGTTNPATKFTVAGTAKAEEVIVEENVGADFVFEENYNLPDLADLESFIRSNKHLPEIPSAEDMKQNGVKVGKLQIKLLQKIEELTLHTIRQEKKINNLSTRVKAQRQIIKQLQNQ